MNHVCQTIYITFILSFYRIKAYSPAQLYCKKRFVNVQSLPLHSTKITIVEPCRMNVIGRIVLTRQLLTTVDILTMHNAGPHLFLFIVRFMQQEILARCLAALSPLLLLIVGVLQ